MTLTFLLESRVCFPFNEGNELKSKKQSQTGKNQTWAKFCFSRFDFEFFLFQFSSFVKRKQTLLSSKIVKVIKNVIGFWILDFKFPSRIKSSFFDPFFCSELDQIFTISLKKKQLITTYKRD